MAKKPTEKKATSTRKPAAKKVEDTDVTDDQASVENPVVTEDEGVPGEDGVPGDDGSPGGRPGEDGVPGDGGSVPLIRAITNHGSLAISLHTRKYRIDVVPQSTSSVTEAPQTIVKRLLDKYPFLEPVY
ncbi:hypothetical protein [Endozoicomonas lisbonensis]|uniref:Uncharacterized protein n=1 Tax=Endozoicomonas lisbonensis TaxID=3120522 RepID=A0ABV2SP91_9GAMM